MSDDLVFYDQRLVNTPDGTYVEFMVNEGEYVRHYRSAPDLSNVQRVALKVFAQHLGLDMALLEEAF